MTARDDPGGGQRRGSFFGRRAGRPLRRGQTDAVASVPRLALDAQAPAPLAALFAAPVDGVRLEIGFGGGEHLVHRAAEEPAIGFIGVEPFQAGFAKAAARIVRDGLRNVRLHDADAGPLLDWLPAASLRSVDLLYPDPWPKARHWKRRFVNATNLDRIARVLVARGRFRFASDWPDYVDWTLQHVLAGQRFEWEVGNSADWRQPFAGWPGTRYEAKALREGRTPAYLTFWALPDTGQQRGGDPALLRRPGG